MNDVGLVDSLIQVSVEPQHMSMKVSNHGDIISTRKTASIWAYSCQIVFQACFQNKNIIFLFIYF